MQKATSAPKVSVIMAVYNVAPYLNSSLSSILKQTWRDFEVICVDDGSTDDSLAVLRQFAARDARVAVYSQANAGQGSARNLGLSVCRGSYVLMVDADDILESKMLEKLLAQAASSHADIVVCRSGEFDDRTKKRSPSWWTLRNSQLPRKDVFSCRDMPDFIFSAFMGWAWDKLYRREFLVAHELSFPDLANSEDLVFVFSSLVLAERIAIVEDILVWHRVNRGTSVSGSRSENPHEFYQAIGLLKESLQRDQSVYQLVEYGFLNWSFDYLVWNIRTMSDQQARRLLIAELCDGAFSDVACEQRSRAFYSLYPNTYWRFRSLVGFAEGGRPSIHAVNQFLTQAEYAGWLSAVSMLIRYAADRAPISRLRVVRAVIWRRPERRGSSFTWDRFA